MKKNKIVLDISLSRHETTIRVYDKKSTTNDKCETFPSKTYRYDVKSKQLTITFDGDEITSVFASRK